MRPDESSSVADTSLVQTADWPDKERLANEKEVLGFYLTSHPLAEHREVLATHCSHTTTSLAGVPQRTEVTMGGMLSSIKFCAHEESAAGIDEHQICDVRFGRFGRHRPLHCLAGGVRKFWSVGASRRDFGRARRRSIAAPAATRRI